MPSTSDKQRRAMAAAAAGNSTIGIPQSVGKEFAMADGLRKHPGYKHNSPSSWKPGSKYGGSNQGGGSIGGGSAGG